jgi:delta-lactam-biosynthetic de-N-acetylase
VKKPRKKTGEAIRIPVVLLLIIAMLHSSACLVIEPGQTTTLSDATRTTPSPTPEQTGSETTRPPDPSPTASPTPEATPTAVPTPIPSPTETSTTTIGPLPSAAPEPTGQPDWSYLELLDNTKTGWYYMPAEPPGSDVPASVPGSVQTLIQNTRSLWQEQNPQGKPLYLTMDEGYEYQNLTAGILDIARDFDVTISFFITGSYLAKNPRTVQRMVDEGHLVLNHTEHHPNLPLLLEEEGPEVALNELRQVERAFFDLTGQQMLPFIRPPEGSYSERLLTLLDQAGYRTVFWSFAYRDWLTDAQPEPEAALEKVLANLHPGSILLLHAVSETNQIILPQLITAARSRGYRFEPLTALSTP